MGLGIQAPGWGYFLGEIGLIQIPKEKKADRRDTGKNRDREGPTGGCPVRPLRAAPPATDLLRPEAENGWAPGRGSVPASVSTL